MSWNKRKEEIRLCEEWLKDPLVNPKTGRPIERGGPKYQEWEHRCKKLGLSHRPVATGKMTWRKCQEFRKNPHVNPETGRKITPGSPTWKKIYKQCKCIEQKGHRETILGEYPVPDKNGLVPAKRVKNSYYIVRYHESRPVYGTLNKYADNAVQVYFKDTWDYLNGRYKPIFRNGEPQRPVYLPAISKIKKTKENPKRAVDGFLNIFMN